jgi:hypothetical protein
MERADETARRLRELRREGHERLAVGASALLLAVAASILYPPLAVPLLLGGVGVGVLGLKSLWHHWDLGDRVARDG